MSHTFSQEPIRSVEQIVGHKHRIGFYGRLTWGNEKRLNPAVGAIVMSRDIGKV